MEKAEEGMTNNLRLRKMYLSYIVEERADKDRLLLSQSYKTNFPIFDGLSKSLAKCEQLMHVQILNQKMSTKCWQSLGEGIGQNESIKTVSINVCNLNNPKNIMALMSGFQKNNHV